MKREDVKRSLMNHKLGFELLMERLKSALHISSDAELSKLLGMSSSNLSNRKKIGSVPFDIIIPLCLSRTISTDWLFRGVGTPFTDDEQAAIEPVAAVDPQLLGAVVMELERAVAADAPDAKERIDRATKHGLLAADIYNRVAFEKNDKARRQAVRDEAEMFARAMRVLEQQPSIEKT